MKLAALIVLYHPEIDIFKNIDTYINDVEIIFIVNNSINSDSDIVTKLKILKKVFFIDNCGNNGIAMALNMGALTAIANGYDWLLTLDQDSSATSGMISKMTDFILKYRSIDKLGILSPRHDLDVKSTYHEIYTFYESFRINKRLEVMTSGNFLNLKVYSRIGPFEEKLFIDYVDHEYCLRLNKMQYEVIELIDVKLNHHLGDFKETSSLIKFYCTNHNYIRRYYITRNRLYVLQKYKKYFPDHCRNDFWIQIKEWVKIILGEEDKIRKIKSIIRGIRDFRKGKFGIYDYN